MSLTAAEDDSYWLNLCSELGTKITGPNQGFVKNEGRCMKSLKRIRKELNIESKEEKNDALILFGDVGLLQNYLIPLAEGYGTDTKLLIEVFKVTLQLTMPIGPSDHTNAEKRLNHLRKNKSEFLKKGVLSSYLQILDTTLGVPSSKRTATDRLVVELTLWLLRNLLNTPDAPPAKGIGPTQNAHFKHLHDDFRTMLSREGVVDLILFLVDFVTGEGNESWNVIMLEIMYHLFRGIQVDDLVLTKLDDSLAGLTPFKDPRRAVQSSRRPAAELAETDELAAMLVKSRAKTVHLQKTESSRHARFGGMLQLSNSAKPIVSNAFAAKQVTSRNLAVDLARNAPSVARKRIRGGRKNDEDALDQQQQLQQDHILGTDTRRGRQLALGAKVQVMLRDLCERFVTKNYGAFMQAIKRDISREGSRILPTDHLQFMSVVGLCTGFERKRVEQQLGKGTAYLWHESPVIKTMDRWTFNYVLKMCTMYETGKHDREQEIAIAALKEMVEVLVVMQSAENTATRKFGRTLRNLVLYNIGEVSLVPQLIRSWTPAKQSWHHLCNLALLGNALVHLAGGMAEEKVIVRTKSRRGTKKLTHGRSNGSDKVWTANETTALAEAVAQFGNTSSSKTFRSMLRDPVYSQIFDASRDERTLARRWKQVEKEMEAQNIGIEEFLQQESEGDADNLNVASNEEDAEAETQEYQEDLERAKQEKAIELREVLRDYTRLSVLKNLCVLLDPGMVEGRASPACLYALHETAVNRFLQEADETNRGQLWHIEFFGAFSRFLDKYTLETRPKLCATVTRIISEFFQHAPSNNMAYVELLFYRTRAENELMLNHYEDPTLRKARLRDEQAQAEDAELEKMELERGNSSEEDDYNMEDGRSERNTQKHRKHRKEADPDESGEEEADLDTVQFCGKTRKTAQWRKSAKSSASTLWSPSEARRLSVEYRKLREQFPFENDTEIILRLDDTFAELGKTVDDVKAQLLRLRELRELQSSPHRQAPVVKLGTNGVQRKTLTTCVENGLGQALRWVVSRCMLGHSVLVPTLPEHYSALEDESFHRALQALGFFQDRISLLYKTSEANATNLANNGNTTLDHLFNESDEDSLEGKEAEENATSQQFKGVLLFDSLSTRPFRAEFDLCF